MPDDDYDLIIHAGRVVCPLAGLDGPGGVAVRAWRIVAAGRVCGGTARVEYDFPDGILLPGLIDLHAHPATQGSKYGVDPDLHFLPRGVTTVLSQGDAGAAGWPLYRETTIRASRTRVLLAINLSRGGESMPGGCFEQMEWADVDACAETIRSAGSDVWGIAVNVSEIACVATDPREVLRRAIAAAEATGKPLLFGIHHPAKWPLDEQLAMLRPGDVMTYFYRGGEHRIVDDAGRVLPAVRRARERGVLFDVGHGMQSFSFAVAEAAIRDGFPPDTISTDAYARHIGSVPIHDLPRTMSKLRAAGMTEREVFAAATSRPARILGLKNEIGSLRIGACADLTVLRENASAAPLADVAGETRPGACWEAALTVRAGECHDQLFFRPDP